MLLQLYLFITFYNFIITCIIVQHFFLVRALHVLKYFIFICLIIFHTAQGIRALRPLPLGDFSVGYFEIKFLNAGEEQYVSISFLLYSCLLIKLYCSLIEIFHIHSHYRNNSYSTRFHIIITTITTIK